jgi:hypothetical protein
VKVWNRITGWWRRRRRRRAARRGGKADLREFVYLDEVSVYSLIASRTGAVPSEITETESALLRSELSSSVGAGAGVAKAEVGSTLEAQQSKGSQVVRKALVQSTFKELFDLESASLPLRAAPPAGDRPAPADAEALLALAAAGPGPWVVSTDALHRGTLFELEVELEAESIFRMSAIMTAFFEMVDENPKMLGSLSVPSLLDSFAVNKMLERLLAGLVPVRGRAVHHRYVKVGSKGLIVHTSVLEAMGEHRLPVQPLFVVGVAERELFWRDIRRVLFSGSRYSVLCRLGEEGTQASWTPVKLVDVLKEVSADLGAHILEAGSFLDRRRRVGERNDDDALRETAMAQALTTYASDLARQYGHPVSVEELGPRGLPPASLAGSNATRVERRTAFAELTRSLEQELGFEAETLVAAQLREEALSGAGFDLEGNLPDATTDDTALAPIEEVPRYLDSDIVAIYW